MLRLPVDLKAVGVTEKSAVSLVAKTKALHTLQVGGPIMAVAAASGCTVRLHRADSGWHRKLAGQSKDKQFLLRWAGA